MRCPELAALVGNARGMGDGACLPHVDLTAARLREKGAAERADAGDGRSARARGFLGNCILVPT